MTRVARSMREAWGHPGPAIEAFDPERVVVGPVIGACLVLLYFLWLAGVLS